MIEFVTGDDKKISVNPKYIRAVRPKREDASCEATVMTFVNGEFLEVAQY